MKEFLIYIFFYDFCYYFLHRLLLTKYFYFIHKIHHKKIEPDYYDYYTINIIEVPITSIGLLISMYIYNIYIYQLICAILYINLRGILSHDSKFFVLHRPKRKMRQT